MRAGLQRGPSLPSACSARHPCHTQFSRVLPLGQDLPPCLQDLASAPNLSECERGQRKLCALLATTKPIPPSQLLAKAFLMLTLVPIPPTNPPLLSLSAQDTLLINVGTIRQILHTYCVPGIAN